MLLRNHEPKAPTVLWPVLWIFLFLEQWLCSKAGSLNLFEPVSARAYTLVDNCQVSVPDSKNHPTLVEDNFCYTCIEGGLQWTSSTHQRTIHWMPVFTQLSMNQISLNFILKNTISTYTKDFPWKKKAPNSPDFERKKSKLPDFYDKFQ